MGPPAVHEHRAQAASAMIDRAALRRAADALPYHAVSLRQQRVWTPSGVYGFTALISSNNNHTQLFLHTMSNVHTAVPFVTAPPRPYAVSRRTHHH